jgi:dipeptidyl aminopeptidase/acylaminoacyl peptidase
MGTGDTPGVSGDAGIETNGTSRLCYREPSTVKKALFCLIAMAAAVTSAQVLTPEQALDRRAIGERGGVTFSPDGSRVAFSVADPVKGTARARSIWIYELAAGRTRQLTFAGKNDFSPRWSPDGASIAFLSDRDGPPQLYLLPMRGGEAEKLTDRKDAIRAFRWAPDGRRIALLMSEPKQDAQLRRERDKDDGRVVDRDERHPRIWLLDVASRSLTQATTNNWRIHDIEWMPDGTRLVAVASEAPASDSWHERIYTIDLSSGRFTPIGEPHRPIGEIAVSPDGRTIAYVGARVDGPAPHDLYLQPIGGGPPQNLTAATLDRPVGQPLWLDNESLAVSVARGFANELAVVSRDGRARIVERLNVNPTIFSRSRSGVWIYVGETATRAPELWVKPEGGGARAVTDVNAKWKSLPIATPEILKYKSFDGVDIEGALLKPPGPFGQPRPFVVLVHGGPTGRWTDTFEPWGQLLAARGYVVLYPNVRGSTGYGQRFVEMNRGDWGGGDFKDVMAGVDWAIARGLADPSRLGIGGWSYGGYMAAWAVTQTTRFKAAVSGAPVIDMASEFGTEDGSAYDEWFYGTPYEKLEAFIKSSQITYVKQVKTPTLLLQGEDDETDPIGQSQQFYRGLKRYGVATDLVVYPREPHGFREEQHLLDRLNRIVVWYDKYLKAPAAGTALRP